LSFLTRVWSHFIVWQDFDRIIKAYTNDRPGSHYVERGDYYLLRADNNQAIRSSEFSRTVRVGMTFEMAVILRHAVKFDKKTRCPRCRRISPGVIPIDGWIEWSVHQVYD